MTIVRTLAMLGLLTASAALAQDGGPDAARLGMTLARVEVPKVYFYDGEKPGCPALTAACRRPAYLRAGELVLVGRVQGELAAASFTAGGKRMTEGWLPRSAIVPVPPKIALLGDWRGAWVRDDEANITIRPGKRPLELSFTGNAMWGSHDPARVARGGVNVGELNEEGTPSSGTITLGKPGEFECRMTMRLIGPYLVVADNNNCGGANVSFSGPYRRAAR